MAQACRRDHGLACTVAPLRESAEAGEVGVLKSYHLLSTCAAPPEGGASVAFARGVATTVDGFVDHAAYVRTARTAVVDAAHVATWGPLDVNPIAELLRCSPDRPTLTRRFNAFNDAASLGVVSRVRGDRITRSGDDGERRAEIMSLTFDWLTRSPARDEPRRLLALHRALDLPSDAVFDVLAHLYEAPGADVATLVTALRCSRRSLQRALTEQGTPFRDLRQAVRLTTAGYRLRNTRASMARVAHDAGFFDSAHLCRAWRTAVGVSPSVYRGWCSTV